MTELVKYNKVVSALPATLDANSVYYVRVANGFDMYVTNDAGIVAAYQLNPPVVSNAVTEVATDTTLDNSQYDHVISVIARGTCTITIDPTAVIAGFRVSIVRRGAGEVYIDVANGDLGTLDPPVLAQRLMENGTVRLTESGEPRITEREVLLSLAQDETAHVTVLSSGYTFVDFPDRAMVLRAHVDTVVADLQSQIDAVSGTPATGTTEFTYSSGMLSRIDYPNGSYKTFAYTGSVLSQVDFVVGAVTHRKVFTYSPAGIVTSITETVL